MVVGEMTGGLDVWLGQVKKRYAPYAWKHAELDAIASFLTKQIAAGNFEPTFPFKGAV